MSDGQGFSKYFTTPTCHLPSRGRKTIQSHSPYIWAEKLVGMNKKNSVVFQSSEPFSLSQLQKPPSAFLQPTLSFLEHPLLFCPCFSRRERLARVHTNTALASVASWAAQSFPNFYSPLWQLDGKKEIESVLPKSHTPPSLFASP